MFNAQQKITQLEARIARLEAFILRDQDEWNTDKMFLENDSLEETIRRTVTRDIFIRSGSFELSA